MLVSNVCLPFFQGSTPYCTTDPPLVFDGLASPVTEGKTVLYMCTVSYSGRNPPQMNLDSPGGRGSNVVVERTDNGTDNGTDTNVTTTFSLRFSVEENNNWAYR